MNAKNQCLAGSVESFLRGKKVILKSFNMTKGNGNNDEMSAFLCQLALVSINKQEEIKDLQEDNMLEPKECWVERQMHWYEEFCKTSAIDSQTSTTKTKRTRCKQARNTNNLCPKISIKTAVSKSICKAKGCKNVDRVTRQTARKTLNGIIVDANKINESSKGTTKQNTSTLQLTGPAISALSNSSKEIMSQLIMKETFSKNDSKEKYSLPVNTSNMNELQKPRQQMKQLDKPIKSNRNEDLNTKSIKKNVKVKLSPQKRKLDKLTKTNGSELPGERNTISSVNFAASSWIQNYSLNGFISQYNQLSHIPSMQTAFPSQHSQGYTITASSIIPRECARNDSTEPRTIYRAHMSPWEHAQQRAMQYMPWMAPVQTTFYTKQYVSVVKDINVGYMQERETPMNAELNCTYVRPDYAPSSTQFISNESSSTSRTELEPWHSWIAPQLSSATSSAQLPPTLISPNISQSLQRHSLPSEAMLAQLSNTLRRNQAVTSTELKQTSHPVASEYGVNGQKYQTIFEKLSQECAAALELSLERHSK